MKKKRTENGNSYDRQKNAAFASLVFEVPNFLAVAFSFIVTGSMLLLTDLFNSLCNTSRSAFVAFLSKRLGTDRKYTFNYGLERIDALSSLFCSALLILGSLCVLVCSVWEFFRPKAVSDYLIWTEILKVLNVTVDVGLTVIHKRAYNADRSSKVARTQLVATAGALAFDAAVLLSILLTWIFKSSEYSRFIEPSLSVLINAVLIVICARQIGVAVNELIDKTLDEEKQFAILKVINRYNDCYDELFAVNSRLSGGGVRVDLELGFDDGTPYADIAALTENIHRDLNELLGPGTVALVINGDRKGGHP